MNHPFQRRSANIPHAVTWREWVAHVELVDGSTQAVAIKAPDEAAARAKLLAQGYKAVLSIG